MNRSVLLALVTLFCLSLWMLSGNRSQATVSENIETEVAKPLVKVRTKHSTARPVQRFTRVQGQVEAGRVIRIKSEVEGKVQSLPVDKGQRVLTGDLLLKLDQAYRPAQLEQAKALLKQRQSEMKASLKLLKRGLQAENQYVADQAAVQAAKAQLELAHYQLTHTNLIAPFSGVINDRYIEIGDFVEKGQVIAQLVDDDTLRITGQVPQSNIDYLKLGQTVPVVLANNEVLEGELSFISALAETNTRSYRVEVSVRNPTHRRLIGQSASLKLNNGKFIGHHVPSSVLSLDATGDLQVKTVSTDKQVKVNRVDIIRTDSDGFWIKGLQQFVTLITVGQNFVSDEQYVEPIDELSGEAL